MLAQIKTEVFSIVHPKQNTVLTLVRAPSVEAKDSGLDGWDLELRKRVDEENSRTALVKDLEVESESQLWLFRYDCIVNMKHPWICLDPSNNHLRLARFRGEQATLLDVLNLGGSDDSFALASMHSNSYISNRKCRKSGKFLCV